MSCAICGRPVDKENAPILTMGGYGNPRYVCEHCSADLEVVTEGTDAEKINLAINSLADKISKKNTDDSATLNTLSEILKDGRERAETIKNGGVVDTAEVDECEMDDIPEHLAETEEDKAKDTRDAAKNAKIQKILDVLTYGIFGAAVVALVIYFIFLR